MVFGDIDACGFFSTFPLYFILISVGSFWVVVAAHLELRKKYPGHVRIIAFAFPFLVGYGSFMFAQYSSIEKVCFIEFH